MKTNAKSLSRLLAMLFAFQSLAPSAAWAAPFYYYSLADNSQSCLKTTLPIAKIGKLAVPGGKIIFEENEIDVQAVPEGLFDERVVLSGVMIGARTIPAGTPQAIKGLAYFFGGPWLNYLSQAPTFEVVTKSDGTIVTGQISGGDEKSLSVHKASGENISIDFNQISNIESPRAYSFLLPVTQNPASTQAVVQGYTSDIRMVSNNGAIPLVATKRYVAPLPGDEKGITRGQILSFLAMDLFWTIAPAVVTPLVINNKNNHTAAATSYKANTASGLP